VRFIETEIPGAFVLELERIEDERGFFARAWARDELAALGLDPRIEQCSVAFNDRVGTLRGLHFQREPHAEVKLVRCTRGAIWDVVVDLRPDSPAYLRWTSVELTADNRLSFYIPEGLAHGYQTLVDATEVHYQISAAYAPDAAQGVRWDDPAFAIGWPDVERRVISERDRAWPDYVPSRRRRAT
jgi:dTDP-4-dehydrorhamnose 3,5-epimerase